MKKANSPPKDKCAFDGCVADATHYVQIDAYISRWTKPIQMLLALPICKLHTPSVDNLGHDIWDALDTWAIQGRRGLCDRELTEVYPVRMDDPDADIVAHHKKRASLGNVDNRRIH